MEIPSSSASFDAIVISPVTTEASASRISCSFSSARASREVRHDRRHPCLHRPRRDDTGRLRRQLRRLLGREDQVRVVREDDHLLGVVASIAPTMSPTDGFLVCPPSMTVSRRLSKIARLPSPGTDRDDSGLESRCRHTSDLTEPQLPGNRLCMHVRDLDLLDHARGARERERCARVVGVDVHLERRLVADDEQRVADPLERVLELDAVEALALDDEAPCSSGTSRAPGGSPRRPAPPSPTSRRRQRLAGGRERHAANDLDEAGTARVDDARLGEDVEQLGRACQRLLSAPQSGPQEPRGRLRALELRPRPPQPSRG